MKRLSAMMCCVAFVVIPAAAAQPPAQAEIETALRSAAAFLFDRQSEDGAWRSASYGIYRDGPSLTAHVTWALVNILPDDDRTKRGLDYLASHVNDEGEIAEPLLMPVYTAAQTAMAMMVAGRAGDAPPWLKLLLAHQMTEDRGFSPGDAQYGGWGYSASIPHRPDDDERAQYVDANISATVFALEALRMAQQEGVLDVDRGVFTKALFHFIAKCQNLTPPHGRMSEHDDGGFFFTPIDAARNKAGAAGIDEAGRLRFHSYGSATADGFRSLVLAGGQSVRDRMARLPAARHWLRERLDATSLPGTFNADREVLRDAYFYYWVWSMSGVMRELRMHAAHAGQPMDEHEARSGDHLVQELLRRRNDDGSWTNPFSDGREDDPLIATPFAMQALNPGHTAEH